MSIADVGISEGDLTSRLKIVNVVPVALVVATVGALLLAGAPRSEPTVGTFLANVELVGWPVLVIGLVGSVLVGLLLQPLELATVRLLEGYWRPSGPLAGLARHGVWIQRRRLSRLVWIRRRVEAATASADVEIRNFPLEQEVLPTGLGNRLRGMEERAGSPYALNVIDLWPRLYLVLSDDVLKKVDNHRDQLDTSCRLCIACAFAGVATGVLLVTSGPWLLLPVAFFGLSRLAYRASLHAASSYGVAVCAAVDTYRLKLLQAAKIELPRNSNEERTLNKALALYWGRRGGYGSVDYSRTDNDFGVLGLVDPPTT